MAIRLTGINSGLDTDTIVQALVSSYSYKKETYTKAQTKLSWTQDAWKSLNTKVYSLYTNISNLRFSTAYNLRKTTSSDATKATVTASNSAVNGTQKLNILQTAQAGYLTGGKLDGSVTTSSTLAELGYTGKEASINVDRGDGTSSTITVKSTSTVGDVINQLKNAGLNASLDTTNNRIFVSAKDSGADSDFNLIAADANGASVLSALGLSTSLYSSDGSLTGAGAVYQKYAAYATDVNGNAIADIDTVKFNISDALAIYEDNAKIYQDANTQISNLTSAISYATAYGNMQDYYAQNGIDEAEQNRFDKVISNYSKNSTALVDDQGNIYTKTTSKDADGNEVYGYVDSDGNSHHVAQVVTYTLDGETYRKNADGKYVNVDTDEVYNGSTTDLVKDENKNVTYHALEEQISYASKETDEDGNAITYNVQSRAVYDADGNETGTEYYFTKDGKEYVSSKETGNFTYTGDDGTTEKIAISKKYSYVEDTTVDVSDVQSLTGAYAAYQEEYGFTDEEATVLQSNLKKVAAFESQVTDTENVTYSKWSIMNEVEAAYEAGGADAINDLLGEFANRIADLKAVSTNANALMEDNNAVANLAGITDPDTREAAIAATAAASMSAVEILSNPANATGAATKIDGQDAVIKLNGVEFTSTSNSIEVNGLTVNALAVTGDGDDNAITITTATDTQGIYDKIKDFLTEYNTLINEMCKLYNAESSKGYDPLTDEEKESMTESEIEKWETKIKDSLLRKDTTLNSVMTSMTNAMMSAITINGKRYNLSSFGIKTLGYFNSAENENYAYHIDGDEDDANTSGNTDRLMAMITSDPDTVMTYFQQLTSNLYKAIGDKMQSTSLSSIYTIYNDKQMATQYSEYTSLIKEWEEKISDREEYYYNKFSSMESALATLNSTQSSLSSFFA